jgi:hypothetical protein
MNRTWLRSLVGAAWGIPIVYTILVLFVFGESLSECSGSLIRLWINSVLLQAAAIFGLLAVRIDWLGLAAAGAVALNVCLYWMGIEEFLSLMG